ncbi:MAG: hypothetical protein ACFB2Z_00610 [Maricaulaceae bacterium]
MRPLRAATLALALGSATSGLAHPLEPDAVVVYALSRLETGDVGMALEALRAGAAAHGPAPFAATIAEIEAFRAREIIRLEAAAQAARNSTDKARAYGQLLGYAPQHAEALAYLRQSEGEAVLRANARFRARLAAQAAAAEAAKAAKAAQAAAEE